MHSKSTLSIMVVRVFSMAFLCIPALAVEEDGQVVAETNSSACNSLLQASFRDGSGVLQRKWTIQRYQLCQSKPKTCYRGDTSWVDQVLEGTPPTGYEAAPKPAQYDAALASLNLAQVKADIVERLTDSDPNWPADYGNYGPFFVRLAWHCSGTFRKTDGVGGCSGGRQRFDVEASWPDNTNLDKARALLAPIKNKYGIGLSWGDLFVLAGTTALRSMGAPIATFCAGRIDDPDGQLSAPLGPTAVQEETAPCAGPENGACQDDPDKTNLAPTTIGLIYVNPEGPMGDPDPSLSANQIRVSFGKMGHDDRSTVALIGGGHAFGKTHGACTIENAAGSPPDKSYNLTNPHLPWLGKCGSGKLKGKDKNTFTSGFEGPWTSTPTRWGNEYFKYLLEKTWAKKIGPGGHWQWYMTEDASDPIMRLTTDLALINDPEYKQIVEEFAANMTALDEAFDRAWTDLTTSGGKWSPNKKCDSFTPLVYMQNMMASDVSID